MNNINKYIDWSSIWNNEVNLLEELEYLTGNSLYILKSFIDDKDVELDPSECEISGKYLIFTFSESGGQNESDTQGWSREYWFTVDPDSDFEIKSSEYQQG